MNTTLGRGAVQQVVTDYPQTKAELQRISRRLSNVEIVLAEARREARKAGKKRPQPDFSEVAQELFRIGTLLQVDLDIRHGRERVEQFIAHRKRAHGDPKWWQ